MTAVMEGFESRKYVCSVNDAVAGAWMTPLYFQSAGQAVRSFQDACDDKQNEIGRHPEDYALFHIGYWDEHNGVLEVLPTPVNLITGANARSG